MMEVGYWYLFEGGTWVGSPVTCCLEGLQPRSWCVDNRTQRFFSSLCDRGVVG